MVTVVFVFVFSFLTFLSLGYLFIVSNSSLLLSFSILLSLFQISLNAVLVFLASFYLSPSGDRISASCSSPILSTRPPNFDLLLINFFLKLSFTPISTLSSSILLLSALFAPTILLIPLFFANLHLFLLFLCWCQRL